MHFTNFDNFNFYSGRPRVGLSVNNKEKVRQAMVKISRGGLVSNICHTEIIICIRKFTIVNILGGILCQEI